MGAFFIAIADLRKSQHQFIIIILILWRSACYLN